MELISVIVPLFRGEKYISEIIRQVKSSYGRLDEDYKIELIFVNDDPEKKISKDFSRIDIKIFLYNLDYNHGIHGARLEGLNKSNGDYILFLDQDDRISSDYFRDQLDKLGDADAVICQAINENRYYYDNRRPFHKVLSKEYMLNNGNFIVSPGQVLLRRDAIPLVWRNCVMENNGADDWLLWLCMYGEDAKIQLNQQVLYEHIVNGKNVSWNTAKMMKSESEMLSILRNNNVLTDDDMRKLEKQQWEIALARVRTMDLLKEKNYVYDKWLNILRNGIRFENFFIPKGIKNIAIYGYSDVGRQIFKELHGSSVKAAYFIDQNARYIISEDTIYSPDEDLPGVDLIVNSLMDDMVPAVYQLGKSMGVGVITVKKIIEGMQRI